MSERLRGFYNKSQIPTPLNIKILKGLQRDELKEVMRITKGAATEPRYVNPGVRGCQ